MRTLPRLACACLLCMTLVLPVTAAPRIWVALAQDGGAYVEAAAVLKADLANSADVVSERWQVLFDGKETLPELVVTVGVAALDGTLERLAAKGRAWERVPVLAILLPQAAYEVRAPAAGRRPISAVVLDQPPGRQMALIKRALPERRRVGVLPGPQTQPLLKILQKEAAQRGLTLVAAPLVNTPEAIYPALKSALETSDVILALPEPTVYHGASLQNILLTTYRARVPLVAFSAAYAKAGAALALYSTPGQVARRAVAMVDAWLAGNGLPVPQVPQEFAVATNAKVAASLGLILDDAASIAEDLRRLEAAQ